MKCQMSGCNNESETFVQLYAEAPDLYDGIRTVSIKACEACHKKHYGSRTVMTVKFEMA